jgi:hypothetical protein
MLLPDDFDRGGETFRRGTVAVTNVRQHPVANLRQHVALAARYPDDRFRTVRGLCGPAPPRQVLRFQQCRANLSSDHD